MRGLKRGALVVLRSGGPEMVIERIDTLYGSPERYAYCKWFDKLRLRSDRFAVHVLQLSSPAPDEEPRVEPDAIRQKRAPEPEMDEGDETEVEDEYDEEELEEEEEEDAAEGSLSAAIAAARLRAASVSAGAFSSA